MATLAQLNSIPAQGAASFRLWLADRIASGETRQAIGRSLGVTGEAVSRWLQQRAGVSQTVLLLAAHLSRAPIDLAAGLPDREP